MVPCNNRCTHDWLQATNGFVPVCYSPLAATQPYQIQRPTHGGTHRRGRFCCAWRTPVQWHDRCPARRRHQALGLLLLLLLLLLLGWCCQWLRTSSAARSAAARLVANVQEAVPRRVCASMHQHICLVCRATNGRVREDIKTAA